jgi:hypothetical protein
MPHRNCIDDSKHDPTSTRTEPTPAPRRGHPEHPPIQHLPVGRDLPLLRREGVGAGRRAAVLLVVAL